MATIPVPALHTAPIEQPENALEAFARLLGIQNQQQELQQRQALAPLQQQEAQQQVQAGQLENQQKQQLINDQQTLRTLQPNFLKRDSNGNASYDFEGLFNSAASQGVSPATLAALRKNISDGALAQANAGKAQIDNLQALNTQAFEHLEGLRGAQDPEQRQQVWESALHWAVRNQEALGIDAGKFPAVAPDDNALTTLEASLGMHAQQLADAAKLAETAKSTAQGDQAKAATAKDQAETQFYAQNGGAPGVSPDMMAQADWLKKNPGKGPSDYLLWKNQHSPAVVVQNLNNAASAGSTPGAGGEIDWGKTAQRYGMTPAAFDQTAEKYFSTGQLPPIGRSPNAIAMNRDLMNRAAELHPNASLAASSAEFKANADSLKKLQSNFDQVQAFEQTAEKNMDLLQGLAQKIPDLGTRFANVPVRAIASSILGSDNQAAFNTALNTAQTEAAKVLNSSNASGVLSDSARHELQQIVDGNMPYTAMVASLNTLKQDMANRRQAYQQQIADIQGRLKGTAGGGAQPDGTPAVNGPAVAPLKITTSSGKTITIE